MAVGSLLPKTGTPVSVCPGWRGMPYLYLSRWEGGTFGTPPPPPPGSWQGWVRGCMGWSGNHLITSQQLVSTPVPVPSNPPNMPKKLGFVCNQQHIKFVNDDLFQQCPWTCRMPKHVVSSFWERFVPLLTSFEPSYILKHLDDFGSGQYHINKVGSVVAGVDLLPSSPAPMCPKYDQTRFVRPLPKNGT